MDMNLSRGRAFFLEETMNEKRWQSAGWFTILVFPLAFLYLQDAAFAQYYKTINKDGTISFSDNPTSSILQRNPVREMSGPEEDKEKPLPADSGRIADEGVSPKNLETRPGSGLNGYHSRGKASKNMK